MKVARFAVSCSILVFGVLAGPAFAEQSTPVPSPAAASDGVAAAPGSGQAASDQQTQATPPSSEPDIIVTAQKRSESVQRVPLAVSVLQPAALTAAGATNLQDLGKVAPSLTITPESQPGNTSIILRGVGTFAFSLAVEPAVAIIIDDVPQPLQGATLTTDLGDIDRVEVLRGPQSTLYGKSASAGLINIVTKAPTDHLTASGDFMATNDREYRAGGTISGPITDTLRFRLTGSYNDYAGSGRNLTDGSRINGLRTVTIKPRLVWTPTDRLTIDVAANYNSTRSDCCTAAYIDINPAGLLLGTNFTGAQVTRGETVDRSNRDVRIDSPLYADSKLWAQSLKVAYEFPSGLQVMSITSHQLYRLYSGVDNDFSDLDIIGARSGGTVVGKYVQTVNNRVETYTQELRLTSPDKGPFRYVAGLYYQQFDGAAYFRRGPVVSVAAYDALPTSKSYAAFGQGTLDLGSGTRVIGGLRVNKEDISYRFYRKTNTDVFGKSNSDTVVTGKAALQHDFTSTVMGYLSYTRGYKGQAYDLTSGLNATIAAAFPIKAEHSNAYEVGIRTQFLDRRITLNLTGYWTDYDNFQAQGLLPDIAITPVLANVGSVRTRGFELETTARLGRWFRVNGGVAYTDAKIRSYPNASCYPGQTAAQGCIGGVQNLAGGKLPNAPEWKVNFGGQYTLPLADSTPFNVTLDGFLNYQSKVVYALTNDPRTEQGAYAIVNVALGIAEKKGGLKASVFVNNLFDKQYYTRIDNRASLFNGAQADVGYLPRDFRRYGGIRLSFAY